MSRLRRDIDAPAGRQRYRSATDGAPSAGQIVLAGQLVRLYVRLVSTAVLLLVNTGDRAQAAPAPLRRPRSPLMLIAKGRLEWADRLPVVRMLDL